jgi:transposase-like protein
MEGLSERKKQNYPLQLKKKIAEEIITGLKTQAEVSRDYNIPRNNVKNWLVRYGSEMLKKQTKEVLSSLNMEKSKDKKDVDFEKQVRLLEEENLKLREKLLESNLKAEALNTLIDLAEENYGFSLRKNSGAKQSKD